jgi:hypothetical protein
MAQYPYAVTFADTENLFRYIVRANDGRQAVRRAKRRHLEEHGTPAPAGPEGEPSRLMNLRPKQQNDMFYARIDGNVVSDVPYDTSAQAVAAALRFLDSRRAPA